MQGSFSNFVLHDDPNLFDRLKLTVVWGCKTNCACIYYLEITFFFKLLSQNRCRKRSAKGVADITMSRITSATLELASFLGWPDGLRSVNSLFSLLFHSPITRATEAPTLWQQACVVACLLVASGLVDNLKSIGEC